MLSITTFIHLLAFRGVDTSTECNLTYYFKVKLYGITYSSFNSVMMTLVSPIRHADSIPTMQ